MALPFFAITLFVSAFLLFLVQPIIGKIILPRLGGTPQVWNTCMVFFQMALLAGYAYTHTVSSLLTTRKQLALHGLLLLIPFLILLPNDPFNIQGWIPPPGINPIYSTMKLLTVVVFIPFFVVATSAPLLQKWFASTGHPAAKDPYFLYGASNLGSMLALISYPFLVEPYLLLRPIEPDGMTRPFSQPWIWTYGYGLLVLLVGGCVALVLKSPPSVSLAGHGGGHHPEPNPQPTPTPAPAPDSAIKTSGPGGGKSTAVKKGSKQKQPFKPQLRKEAAPAAALSTPRLDEVTPLRRLRWIGLAAVPSSLMLGITSYITTDLSPIPLFWLIPLTLYLLSFILVFMRWPVAWTGQPHTVMLYLQPFTIALLLFIVTFGGGGGFPMWFLILINVLAFFVTTMVCHGELAKDRPGTKHLTEFYLWMSVGGMLGGMFNGLVAPVLFPGVWEFPLAVFAACLLRPLLSEGGWMDTLFAGTFNKEAGGAPRGGPKHLRKGHPAETESLHYTMDVILPFGLLLLSLLLVFVLQKQLLNAFGRGEAALGPTQFIVFGIPLVICCFFFGRPLRFGLAIGAVLLVHALYIYNTDASLYADRSYFGILRVKKGTEVARGPDNQQLAFEYTQLIHGHINHGMNFKRPENRKLWSNREADFSRLATTYYHRKGPAGVVMELYNWFPGPQNTFWADTRMPASLAALGMDPLSQMVDLWSEPPYATIGLGTGTMASYSRPYQHMHYYEIDNHIKRLSLPPEGQEPYFTYLREAKARGAQLWVLMGDARLRMARPYYLEEEGTEEGKALAASPNPEDRHGGPDSFYHMMVVDAFTSDAIPVHLITKEAIEMYFNKLAPGGILCVHTSNRYVDLVPVVADVAKSLNFASLRGHDNAPANERGERARELPTLNEWIEEAGHFTSEWVMVARTAQDLERLKTPEGYDDQLREQARKRNLDPERIEPYWRIPDASTRNVWTDDYSNLMAVFREFRSGP